MTAFFPLTLACALLLLQHPRAAAAATTTPVQMARGWGGFDDWSGDVADNGLTSFCRGNSVSIFATARDASVWQRVAQPETLSRWQPLGGDASERDGPNAMVQSDGEVDVVIRGSDRNVWINIATKGIWAGFESLGLQTTHRPAIAGWFNRWSYIFARGNTGLMYKVERREDKYWFNGWAPMGTIKFIGPPVAVPVDEPFTHHVFVVAVDADHVVRYSEFDNGAHILLWQSLNITSTCTPAVSFRPAGFDVAVCDAQHALHLASYSIAERVWSKWIALGTPTAAASATGGAPAIAATRSGDVFAFMRDDAQRLSYCVRRADASVSEWVRFQGVFASDPVVNQRGGKFIDLWVLDDQRRVRHATYQYSS